ncbi:MAG TPA: Ku protein [Verrucomicrobiae bacterium]|jgi:DNA end-binding protein Ku|nr:Ku protein [Verrucomicrobiae bacterium]
MAHAIWSGAINFGLVTIPVKLFTAVKTDDLSFNMLHGKDEGRVKYERVCSVDGKPVPWDEIVKGYEYEKGEYVVITEEDFGKVNPEATQSVDILEFVDPGTINPMYFDKPYYLEPSKQGRHAYALLREALSVANKVAIARVVVRTKEYIAAVKPLGDALVLELMHWANEIVSAGTLELPGSEKLPEAEMNMAKMLIDTMTVDSFEPEKFTNRYRDELLAMIEARAAGKELPSAKKAPLRSSKVVNLMDVLAQSLEQSKKQRGSENGTSKATGKRRKKTAA